MLVDGMQNAILSIRGIPNEGRLLLLQGVTRLQVDDFREGNVILAIWLLSAEQASRRQDIVATIRRLFGQDVGGLDRDLNVFILECSYGATLTAICKQALVTDRGATLEVS